MQDNGDAGYSRLHRRDFLKVAAAGLAAGSVVPPVTASAQSGPGKGAELLSTYPPLTDATREWRWGRIRRMMADRDVDAMLVVDDDASSYLSDISGAMLLFPLDGEPVAFTPFDGGALRVDKLMKSEAAGIESWVRDRRISQGTLADVVDALKEKGLQNARIGTFGVEVTNVFRRVSGNWRPGGMGDGLKAQLPGVSLVELWNEFMDVWLVKNDEELAMLRKAAAGLELGAALFRDACVPGNTLLEVNLASLAEPSRYGLNMGHTWTGSGPDGGRGIRWMERGMQSPVLEAGDLVVGEYHAECGPMQAQTGITVSVGEPSPKKRELAALCRESYEIGLETMRPGLRFGELAEAMAEPNRRAGAWQLSPLIHTLNPSEAVSTITEGIKGERGFPGVEERFAGRRLPELGGNRPDLVIQESMTFQIEPNSAYEKTVMGIGGTVIVGADGVEELNPLTSRMLIVDA